MCSKDLESEVGSAGAAVFKVDTYKYIKRRLNYAESGCNGLFHRYQPD